MPERSYTVYLSARLHKILKTQARNEKRTLPAQVNTILEDYLMHLYLNPELAQRYSHCPCCRAFLQVKGKGGTNEEV